LPSSFVTTLFAMSSSLKEGLKCHMADDSLIKGWEVAKRTCNGRERGPLRKAAREVNAIRNSVLEGSASEATNRKYVIAIQTLYSELAKAGEQDFDGMLGEALGWLEAQDTGTFEHRLPVPAPLTSEQLAALERIRDYRFTNSPGHIGRAIDRDLRLATEIAKEVRAGLAAMSNVKNGEELLTATSSYVDAADRFCAELAHAGEPDFDGLLRQAVLVLDSAPGKDGKEDAPMTSKETSGGKRTNEEGKGKKGGKQNGKGAKGGGKSKGGYGHGKTNNYSAKGNSGYWESPGKGESKKRRWHAKDAAWPDETSWGA